MPALDLNRPVAIDVWGLDEDKTGFVRMRTYEALSEPFRYDIEVFTLDEDARIPGLIGANATVRMDMGDGQTRYYNGFIESFGLVPGSMEHTHYELTLRPWFWFLTKTRSSRIFQNQSVPDIVKAIFKLHGFGDHNDELRRTYKPREYCVQYNESDFDFVSRLLEEEGIFYLFRHENGKHELCLGDDISSNKFLTGGETVVNWRLPGADESADSIDDWRNFQRATTERFVLDDFDFKKPKTQLEQRYVFDMKQKLSNFEVYDPDGKFTEANDGLDKVNVIGGTAQIHSEYIEGAGTARTLAAGYNFTLKEHPISNENRTWTVYALQEEVVGEAHQSGASGGTGGGMMHRCRFVARASNNRSYPIRRTPRPIIPGPQTALVTGPAGEEIHTDEFGRVKVQFHWDRDSKADENSSCWIRVSQPWAGKKWGAVNIPRIGHEVIVDFINGDPDRPIITGRVYNGEAKPPYDLPSYGNLTSFMTLSSKGGGGYNELAFWDQKGKERVFQRAERNYDLRVQKDYMSTTGGNLNELVKGSRFVSVGGDYHTTTAGDSLHKIGGDLQTKIDSGVVFDATAGILHKSGESVTLKAPSILIEGDTAIMLKVGGSSIYLGPAGIFIHGPMTMINSGPGGAVVLIPPMMGQINGPAEAVDGTPGETTETDAPKNYEKPHPQKPDEAEVQLATALEQAHQLAAPFVDPAGCPFAH